jgi:phenylalanyl-tRNA synthetase alpha chain
LTGNPVASVPAPSTVSASQLQRDLALRDLTDPSAGPHAIQTIIDLVVGALVARWQCEVRWWRGPRTVPIEDNYDNLGYDPAAVTRDARYTRYVDGGHVLRSHSTAMIPSALRHLAADPPDDLLLVCPGIVYRRDSIDRLHTGTPHQLDLWWIRRGRLTETDLDEMIACLLDAVVPGWPRVVEPRVHPYTLAGRQVDVIRGEEPVEVLECGLAHPEVLARSGLPADISGLALGMGLDRLLMLVKEIDDIRALRASDPRIVAQMSDLSPYRPVSSMPAVTRDLSLVVDGHSDEESLGDTVRDALGADADAVEEVSVLGETPCSDLPPSALERLGATPGQTNLLVRVRLRHLERTLTAEEANLMRDRIYRSVHCGSVYEWAAVPAASAGARDRARAR